MSVLSRRALALALFVAAIAPAGCRDEPEGTVKVVVIGSEPKLRDPALNSLSAPDAVLLANIAQGLVRFDANGNIVAGLAERWNVSDDGLSYIFRLAAVDLPNRRKLTAAQVVRVLKRSLATRSANPLRDTLGAVEDVVAMTDRVIEIRLKAPRPNLLALLAQPEFGIVRNGSGTGPFELAEEREAGTLHLTRQIGSADGDENRREDIFLSAALAPQAVRAFADGKSDLVLGGTFVDLPVALGVKLPRAALRFDPAAGLFGLMPTRRGGVLDDADVRRLLSQAIDRDALTAALRVPGLVARATVLEPGLEGLPDPTQPGWMATPIAARRAALTTEATRLFGSEKPTIRIYLPDGVGADVLFDRLSADWGAIGLTTERAKSAAGADFKLVDAVAPSTSPAWYLRQFRCQFAPVCDPQADELLDAARDTLVAAQRGALMTQVAGKIDDAQLFVPLAAPVRWSLVSSRIQGFVGNRFARHTLTDLEQKPVGG